MGANLLAAAHCAKHAIPHMARQGGGTVVNVSSVAAVRGLGRMAQYDTTGWALGMTKALAHDHAGDRSWSTRSARARP